MYLFYLFIAYKCIFVVIDLFLFTSIYGVRTQHNNLDDSYSCNIK